MDFVSSSEKDTEKLAGEISENVVLGDVLALYGDLGSGKTTFTKFLGNRLGVKENITSPTFVIEKRYKINNQITNNPLITHGESRSQTAELIHIDCYRMGEQNIDEHYLSELFADKDSVIVIEWPEKIEKYLPKNCKKIEFEYISEKKRKIVS